jgi:hypothetical protein
MCTDYVVDGDFHSFLAFGGSLVPGAEFQETFNFLVLVKMLVYKVFSLLAKIDKIATR